MVMESGNKARESLLDALRCRFRRAVARWNQMQWQDSLEAVAREVNLSKAEFDALMRSSSEEPLSLSLRLSHAGLSEDELATTHADVLRDLRRVCGHCLWRTRCARDLKQERRATPSKYCPNEQTLQALAREARQSASRILPFPSRAN
jgi:hypothetical protein